MRWATGQHEGKRSVGQQCIGYLLRKRLPAQRGVFDENEDCPDVSDDSMLLSFVVDPSKQQVSIHLDEAGVSYLMARLDSIRRDLEAGDCTHVHLLSSEWTSPTSADISLSRKLLDGDGEGSAVHHVKIHGWTPEWRDKHGLERT